MRRARFAATLVGMRIGILADTHDKLERTEAAVECLRRRGARVLFHCGDVTGPDVARRVATLPAYFARGNNDRAERALIRAIRESGAHDLGAGALVTVGGKRIGVTHGHDRRKFRELLAEKPDYLFVGHSHRKSDTRLGATRVINPGALHRVRGYTVALLDLDDGALEFLDVTGRVSQEREVPEKAKRRPRSRPALRLEKQIR